MSPLTSLKPLEAFIRTQMDTPILWRPSSDGGEQHVRNGQHTHSSGHVQKLENGRVSAQEKHGMNNAPMLIHMIRKRYFAILDITVSMPDGSTAVQSTTPIPYWMFFDEKFTRESLGGTAKICDEYNSVASWQWLGTCDFDRYPEFSLVGRIPYHFNEHGECYFHHLLQKYVKPTVSETVRKMREIVEGKP